MTARADIDGRFVLRAVFGETGNPLPFGAVMGEAFAQLPV